MSSTNKLNLKDYVNTDPSQKYQNHGIPPEPHPLEQKPLKNQRKSSNRESKKLKLNTLPCEEVQKDNSEMFLFRSTWEDDIEQLKEEMKGCTSPTFATEILSHPNNHSSLFPFTDQIHEQQDTSKRNRVSNSRSKSKNNKSLQKFIGDSVSTHRPSNSTVEKASTPIVQQSQVTISNSQQEMFLYEMKKLESVTHELRRQNKKLQEKCKQFKQRCQQLEDQMSQKSGSNSDGLMTNEDLLQKMKSESFWKFYLKAQKMIKSSMAQNNQQSFASPINFMKELEALREMSSEMKKENKSLKKIGEERSDELERMKDKVSVGEAEVEEMRLKCVAYESSMKRLREEVSKNARELERMGELREAQQKVLEKTAQASSLSRQVSLLNAQLQEQKLLNSECEKQRISTKKKCQQLNEQAISLSKQLSSLKTSYNLLQIQKQQLSANKKELIEKERLKERVFQLEKEIKVVVAGKEQEIARVRMECEAKFGKEVVVKESRVKELDEKVEVILGNISELQANNAMLQNLNHQLEQQQTSLSQENVKLTSDINELHIKIKYIEDQKSESTREVGSVRKQYESKLKDLSTKLQSLTSKLNQQSSSLLEQQQQIQQLKRQVNQKEELLKAKEYESEKLKEQLDMIKEEQESERQKGTKLPNRAKFSERAHPQLSEQKLKLQQKLNQALQLYEQVYNQKVQLQLQLQQAQGQVQKVSAQLHQMQSQGPNQQAHQQNGQLPPSEDTLQMVENLLSIKEQIIKKILIFCPQDYKSLLVEYIYYGDMIKDKYFQLINMHLQNAHQPHNQPNQEHDASQDESYLQVEDNENFYYQPQTTRNQLYAHSNSRYNQTKPYQSRNPHYDDSVSELNQSHAESANDVHAQQEQINFLVEEFVKIGHIIDEETRVNYLNPKTKDKKKYPTQQQPHILQDIHLSKQKEQEFRKSKEKEIQQSKNLLAQLNTKIQKVKENNINNENSFHYQLASNQYDKKPSKNHKNVTEDPKYPSEPLHRANRQPLQVNEDRSQTNLSRPLFTGKQIKIKNPTMMRNAYQQQQRQQRPYQDQSSVQRIGTMGIHQTPYQKGSQTQQQVQSQRHNFNHGVMNKLSMLKISDRIRQ